MRDVGSRLQGLRVIGSPLRLSRPCDADEGSRMRTLSSLIEIGTRRKTPNMTRLDATHNVTDSPTCQNTADVHMLKHPRGSDRDFDTSVSL